MDLKHLGTGAASLAASALVLALCAAPALATDPTMTQNVTQNSGSNTVVTQDGNNAIASGTSNSHNSGILDSNITAGQLNAQKNVTFLDNDPSFAFTASFTQHSSGDTIQSDSANNALATDTSFQHNNGMVGSNIAAGNLNKQINGAALGYATFSSQTANITQTGVNSTVNTGNLGTASNIARADKNSFNNTSGVTASNIAAGDLNGQVNQLATPGQITGNYSVSLSQGWSGGSTGFYSSPSNPPTNAARATDQAFNNNTGAVTSNIAAGAGNFQANSMVLAGKVLGSYSLIATQTNNGVSVNSTGGTASNDAHADGNAYSNNTGNVAANLAAGNGNLQSNTVAIIP